ncbi:MAG: TonB-dependent receptor [Pseudomonadota bacterium]
MLKKMNLKSSLLATSVIAGASLAMSGSAFAQDAAEDEEAVQETITVTGSRIARADFVSNSPVATVGAEQFDLTGTVNTESLLNTLPQTVPGLDRTSNNPGGGIATVDLRGLGSNRTLVLVDGKRVVPSTGGGTVDINNIPAALIERVEVVTGGASAVYGSDAISGVVNFILKDDFEGAEFSAGYEAAVENWDAQVWSANATIGGNFADGRGNAVVSLGYTSREELFQGDRDFSFFAQFDDGEGGLFDGGSSGVPEGRISGVFGSAGIFNPDGTIREFVSSGDNNDFYNYAPENYIQLPQERFQFNGKADYEINDEIEVYASAFFADNNVPQQLAPTPIFEPRSGTIQVSLDGNPFIAPSAQQQISDDIGSGVDTDGDGIDDEFTAGAFGIRRRLEEVGNRVADNSFTSFQFETGLKWDISDTWQLDVSFSEGRTNGKENQSGNIDKDRFFQALLLADADGDGNVDVDADGNPSCSDPSSSGSLTGACVPINIYGQGNISADAADFIRTLAVIDIDYEMTNFVANVSGDTTGVFELPGGPIGLAFGTEYREEYFDFAPSQAVAAGTISGFNGAPPVTGGFDVYGLYGEAYLPILSDVPFADILALELAYRTEDYSTAGTVEAYKIAGEWAPDEQLRFRASFNTAVRAPSISELFSPQGEGFPGASDPCSSAGAPQDATLTAVCVATGVPAANVGSANIDLPSGQVRQISGGNPDLEAEEAETLTVGFVASPDLVPGLTFSVDYFDIEIENVISAFGGGANNVITTCYGDATLGGAGSPFCNAISRGGDGLITQVSVTSQNVASLTLNGWDILADYEYDAGKWGLFGIDYVGTVTEENTLLPFEGGDPLECAGAFGVDCDDPQPEYKHRLAAKWANGPYTAQLLWRYIGSTEDDGGLSFTPAVEELDAESYFDVSGSWDINEVLTLTGGIDNVLDTEPPILGDNQEQANTFPATYDVFGRTVFLRATARF